MSLETAEQSLRERGFTVRRFETGGQAAQYLEETLHGCTIGFGGSRTAEELGLFERLGRDNTVFWHWKQDFDEACRSAAGARVYITSANALAETGELINIDGYGNRVSATAYGPERVIFVLGKNKLAPTFEQALRRARNVAGPLNARRLHKKTPCATGPLRCYDCRSPERCCRALMVLWGRPTAIGEAEVLLVNEELGF